MTAACEKIQASRVAAGSLFSSEHMVLLFLSFREKRGWGVVGSPHDTGTLTTPSGDPGEACQLGPTVLRLRNLTGQVSALGRAEAHSPLDFSSVLMHTASQRNAGRAWLSGRHTRQEAPCSILLKPVAFYQYPTLTNRTPCCTLLGKRLCSFR